jgi:predicted PurR-regulated permease PerM
MMLNSVNATYILCALAVPLVIHFGLLPAVFAGLAVHVLTVKLALRLPARWGGLTHKVALAAIAVLVVIGLLGSGLGLAWFLNGSGGMAALLKVAAETLETLKRSLPADVSDLIPHTVEDLREQITDMLREHAHRISAAGVAGIKTFVQVLLGMIVGGMTALQHFSNIDGFPPFTSALHARAKSLTDAFDKIVLAQVKISALNTVLTALYLAVFLPLAGVRFPLVTVLIPFTFVTNLLPVLGNVVSNTLIVLISLGISPHVALASYLFLAGIHKLEYLINAHIIGGQVQARSWELLCAMIAMEAIFGIAGLVAAPVAYAWLKSELREQNMI